MNTDQGPDLRSSYLEHRAMRVDAARLTDLVAAAQPSDADRLAGIAAWYTRYERAINDHHTAEEAVVYPALLERDPSFAVAEAELEGQHRVLADRLTVARESLHGLAAASGGPSWERERDDAIAATRALREIVTTHLDHEEDVAFSRYRRVFTATEFAALGATARKLVGARAVIFAGPWVLDHADPAERAQLLADQPLLLRVLYRLVLRPRFDRLARPLRDATATPVTGGVTCRLSRGARRRPSIPTPSTCSWRAACPCARSRRSPGSCGLTGSVVRQLERTDGLVGYSLRAQPFARTFWTLSAWTDAAALTAFVREMPHQGVMAKLRPHMGPTRFTTWTAPGSALPVPWEIAIGHLDSPSARDRATPPLTPHTTDPPTCPSDKEQPS